MGSSVVVSVLSGVPRRCSSREQDSGRVRGTFDSGDLKEVAERRAMEIVPFSPWNEQLATRSQRVRAQLVTTYGRYHARESRGRRPLRSSRPAFTDAIEDTLAEGLPFQEAYYHFRFRRLNWIALE
jgi:hypothetical protein